MADDKPTEDITELAEQAKKNNTIISSLLVSSYNRVKDETNKNIQRVSSR